MDHQARWLNKVPLVTAYFWIIKILSTTVGETGADYLIFDLRFGLVLTSLIAAVAMAAILALQFRTDRYVPWTYWLAVVSLSIVGTLITDNLTDNLGVSLYVSTAVFAAALATTFWLWFRAEGTLSIRAVNTPSREAYYWAAILLTFALGTAAGDLISEEMGLGYALSGVIFAAAIAVVLAAFRFNVLSGVAAFWLAYVLTRPLGASIGDFLTQPARHGGLALSTMTTSAAFLVVIAVLVAYLTLSGIDREERAAVR